MKLIFNHELEDLKEVVDALEIEGVDEEQESELRQAVYNLLLEIQNFDIGMLVTVLTIKNEKTYEKVSELVEAIFNELGLEKFLEFAKTVDKVVQEAREEMGVNDDDAPEENSE